MTWYNVVWTQVKPGSSQYQVADDDVWLGCPEQIEPDDSSGWVTVWKMAGIGLEISLKAVGEMLAKMSLLPKDDIKKLTVGSGDQGETKHAWADL